PVWGHGPRAAVRPGVPHPLAGERSRGHAPGAGDTHDADTKVIPPVPQGALRSRRAQLTVAYWPASA
ncbi:MAG: hypothetical protein J2P17_17975, partial [Mycobacterium sp.]|nr:hypothetical protein [Mycobacterium sp.]